MEVDGDREQVLDDRGGEHRGEQRPTVGVKAEEHDVATLDRTQQIDVVAGRLGAVEEARDV